MTGWHPAMLSHYHLHTNEMSDNEMSSKRNDRHYKVDASDGSAAKRPRTRSQVTKITALNDDCLLEIFPYLSLGDLCAVKESHQRFSASADRIFKANYLNSAGDYHLHPNKCYNLSARAIKLFGKTITRACVTSGILHEENIARKYFTLLNFCSAMEHLKLQQCNIEYISNVLHETTFFENLCSLSIKHVSGTQDHFKHVLNACNPLKLTSLEFSRFFRKYMRTSDDLLAFITDRMFNLEHFEFRLNECTKSFQENLSKLQNLRKLKIFRIVCDETTSIAPIICAMANIDSLEVLEITDFSDIIPNENVVEAINKIANVPIFTYESNRKIPADGKITNNYTYEYRHCDAMKHKYIFNRWFEQNTKVVALLNLISFLIWMKSIFLQLKFRKNGLNSRIRNAQLGISLNNKQYPHVTNNNIQNILSNKANLIHSKISTQFSFNISALPLSQHTESLHRSIGISFE